MKLQYLAVLAAVFACANADAATKKSATAQSAERRRDTPPQLAAENADVNSADNVGFAPLAVATKEVDVITKAIQEYIDKFHTMPPLRHQQLFPLLDGQNPQKYHFLSLESFRRNAHGEVIDPWQEPYRIEKQPGRIIVSSRKIHYVRAVTFSKHPVKSITNHLTNTRSF
jgi:hypothetical protein